MRIYLLIGTLIAYALWPAGEMAHGAEKKCTPAYAVLDKPLQVAAGSWEISFKLLAVGCQESLYPAWPPKQESLERELASEMAGPHPVKTLFLIREQSPDLKRRITDKVNKVLGRPVVQDVFIFDAKAVEGI